MTAALKARLDRAVAAKLLTAAQEQALVTRFSARLREMINRPGLFRPGLAWRDGNARGRAWGLRTAPPPGLPGANLLVPAAPAPPAGGAGATVPGGWDPGPTVGNGANTSTLPAKPLGPAA
jgi:hypothetical protein